MQIFSILLDILNLIAFFFSLQLALSRTVTGLSVLAVIAFSLVPALEYLRKRDVEHILNEPPPLDHHDIFIRTSFKNTSIDDRVQAKIEECKLERQKEAQEKSATYLTGEKWSLAIGIIFTIAIAYFVFFP